MTSSRHIDPRALIHFLNTNIIASMRDKGGLPGDEKTLYTHPYSDDYAVGWPVKKDTESPRSQRVRGIHELPRGHLCVGRSLPLATQKELPGCDARLLLKSFAERRQGKSKLTSSLNEPLRATGSPARSGTEMSISPPLLFPLRGDWARSGSEESR